MEAAASQPFSRYHLLIPAGIALILVAMILPIPKLLLDLLISLDITLSMVVLMVSMYVIRPVQFSVFPSVLLLMTLFRLSLNIASTRLILLNGEQGLDAAGQVIKAFGQFVVGGNFVVGAVIFLVILAVQFIVINHGALRISEVTARFTLDAMPGKQMSIDADLNAGLIHEKEARQRRRAIAEEAEFYGSMDGAVRFTQRDAVASLVIFSINLIAGFAIGVLQHGMQPAEAAKTFSVLTIGDGLVTAIPALLVSVAGAIITTRSSATDNLGTEVFTQVFANPRPLAISGVILAALAFVPGLPTLAFLTLASGTGALAVMARRREEERAAAPEEKAAEAAAAPVEETMESFLAIDTMSLEVGLDLVPLVKPGVSGGVLDRIRAIRRQMASDLGFIVPPVRVRDNLSLAPSQYALLIRGASVATGKIPARSLLALAPSGPHAEIGGTPTTDPAFGLPAAWIPAHDRERARAAGYTLVEPESVISTHLMEVIRRHAPELLGREEVQKLLDILSKSHPKLVAELVPEKVTLTRLQKVLQGLLRERVTIRDLPTILESLAERAESSVPAAALVEGARQALGRSICSGLLTPGGELEVITLEPALERAIETLADPARRPEEPDTPRKLLTRVSGALSSLRPLPSPPVILCSPPVRPVLRDLVEGLLPNLVVLSHQEVPLTVRVRAVGRVS